MSHDTHRKLPPINLTALATAWPAMAPPRGFADRVMAAVEADERRSRARGVAPSRSGRAHRPLLAAAAAAAVAAALVFGPFFLRGGHAGATGPMGSTSTAMSSTLDTSSHYATAFEPDLGTQPD